MIDGQTIVGVVAIVVSILAVGFAGYQIWIQRAASELSFNIQVLERLDTVLMQIAERPDVFAQIWSPSVLSSPIVENGCTHVLTHSLIDVLELALAAAKRLPGFQVNANDWTSYATYVFDRSATVRSEVETNRAWWPEAAVCLKVYRETESK